MNISFVGNFLSSIYRIFKKPGSSKYKVYQYGNCKFKILAEQYNKFTEEVDSVIVLAKMLGYVVQTYQVGERAFDIVFERRGSRKDYRLRFRLKPNKTFGNMDCIILYADNPMWEYVRHNEDVSDLMKKVREML